MDDNNKKVTAEKDSDQQEHAAPARKKGSQERAAAEKKHRNQERAAAPKKKGNQERAATEKRENQERAAAEKRGNREKTEAADHTAEDSRAEKNETAAQNKEERLQKETVGAKEENLDQAAEKKADDAVKTAAVKKDQKPNQASTDRKADEVKKTESEESQEKKAEERKKADDEEKAVTEERPANNRRAEKRQLSDTQVRINSFFDRLRDDKPFMRKVSISCVAVLLLIVIIIAVSAGNKSKSADTVQNDSKAGAQEGHEDEAVSSEGGEQDSAVDEAQASAGDISDETQTSGTGQGDDTTAQVNDLIKQYFDAMASGDTDPITAIKGELTEEEALQIQKKSNYINSFENINVLTKDGPEDDSYIVFVYYEISFKDIDTLAPGLTTLYICKNDQGQLQIYDGELDETVTDYIKNVASAEDVVEIFDRVEVKYNEATDSDATLKSFMESLPATLEKEVAQAMSESQTEETGETAEENTQEETTADEEQVITTDTVNVRSSDSENADKLGKLEEGTTVTRYEAKANGWSRIDYNGTEAYVKSEFVKAAGQTKENDGESQQAETTQDSSQNVETVSGKIVVLETVNVRKAASEQADRIGTAYQGEYYDLIMEQEDGWTKIKFNGEIGYVKSEYVKK